MSRLPKVSIITICYNPGADFLPTVKSVLEQSYSNLEYIIVDGGSKDGTTEILKNLNDNRLKWISEKDNGIYDAMNKGIRMASGEWLNFMNAGDSFVHKNILTSIDFRGFKKVALLYGKHTKDRQTAIYPKKIKVLEYGKIMGCHQAMFFNKQVLGEELIYNDRLILNGDSELVTRIYKKQFCIQFIDELIAFYKGGGASNNFIWKSKFQKYQRVWQYFGVKGLWRTLMMKQGLVNRHKFKIQ